MRSKGLLLTVGLALGFFGSGCAVCGEGTHEEKGTCVPDEDSESDTDEDGDGVSVEDGDCDDTDEDLGAIADDADCDGVLTDEDCDDNDASVYPGATESCDSVDNDCDGTVDEDAGEEWYADGDGDGYGNPNDVATACTQPSGYVDDATDCDDSDTSTNIEGTEICDGVDNDCNGTVDGADATDQSIWYVDADGDGYGDSGSITESCSQPSGYVADATDCDDADATTYLGATEVCDDVDNDCDGSPGYEDADGDGWLDCEDCNDDDASISPDATEICDSGVDEDCNGLADCEDAACAYSSFNCFESACDNTQDDDDDGLVDCVDDDCAGIGDCLVIVSQVSGGKLRHGIEGWRSQGTAEAYTFTSGGAPYWFSTAVGWRYSSYMDRLVAQNLTGTLKVYQNSGVQTCDWAVSRLDLNRSSSSGLGPTSSMVRSGFSTTGACGLSSFFLPQALVASSGWALTTSTGLTWYASKSASWYGQDYNMVQSWDTWNSRSGSGNHPDMSSDHYWLYRSSTSQYIYSWRITSPKYVNGGPYTRSVPCSGDPDVAASTWYLDSDGDGYGDPNEEVLACAAPSAYVADNSDSDDWDSGVH